MKVQEVSEKLPAYVLGALDASDLHDVEAYLHAHRDLLERSDRLEETVVAWVQANSTLALPPAVRGRVKARLIERAQADLRLAPPRRAAHPARESAPTADLLTAYRRWLRQLEPRREPRALALGAICLTLLLSSLYLGHLRTRLDHLQGQAAQMQQEAEVIARAEQSLFLVGTEAAPRASGTLHQHGGDAVLALQGLEPLPPDHVYQPWLLLADGTTVPLWVVAHSADNHLLALRWPADAPTPATVGLTVEATPNGDRPTTAPLIVSR